MSQQKINLQTIEGWSSRRIANYIEAVTQTPICADKKYCDSLIKIYLSKPLKGDTYTHKKEFLSKKAA